MCTKPQYVYIRVGPKFERQDVPCRKCWACRKNRTNDLVGRTMADVLVHKWVQTLTLTYAPGHGLREKIIHKEDFQAFLKAFRHKFPCRYVVAGEYGERKGRVHFHALLFGNGQEPPGEHKTFQKFPNWPWGHVYVDKSPMDVRKIQYIVKYLTKKDEPKRSAQPRSEWLSYSKKPILGHDYFQALARRFAEQKLVPYTMNYLPPSYDGKEKFSMYGAAQTVFFDELLEQWPEFHAKPKTEWVQRAYDRYLQKRLTDQFYNLAPEVAAAMLGEHFRTRRVLTPQDKARLDFSEFDRRSQWASLDAATKERIKSGTRDVLKSFQLSSDPQ
jgi:hypothetical protein